MTENDNQNPVVFSARLTPYRSLRRTGFIVLMVFATSTAFLSGLLFSLLGAWPVTGFFGLDLILLWFAFRMNYKAARAYESITVRSDKVIIRKVSEKGDEQCIEINAFWAKLIVSHKEEEGVKNLTLTSHGKSYEIGSFLNPADKESFAKALGNALCLAKSGKAQTA
jgi:uncharacterized membrane protein